MLLNQMTWLFDVVVPLICDDDHIDVHVDVVVEVVVDELVVVLHSFVL